MFVDGLEMPDGTAFRSLELLEADATLTAAQIPEIDIAPFELGLCEGEEDAALMQVVGRQLVGHDCAAGRPNRMEMCAAAEFWIHVSRRLHVGLVVAQQRLVAATSFHCRARIDNR